MEAFASAALGAPALERRRHEARSILGRLGELVDEVAGGASAVPAAMCTTWRSSASANYEDRLEDLRLEVHLSKTLLDSAGTEMERLIRELDEQIEAAHAAALRAAALSPADWHGTGRGAWTTG
jgi:hypothetical protein